MDKLKTMLKLLKKYHFWVLCGAVVVVGLTVWATASTDLAKQFNQRKDKLGNNFRAVEDICGQPKHPNQGVIEAVEATTDALKENVLEAWEILYHEQKEKNPLPPVLGEDFITVFESLGPEDTIPVEYRERYQNFITYHIPTLFEKVDLLRPEIAEGDAAAEARRGSAPTRFGPRRGEDWSERLQPTVGRTRQQHTDVDWIGVVDWDESDRTRIADEFNWQSQPSTLRVRLAQEDLWVYEALVRIIKNTNEDATTHYNAAVKRIEALEIGRDAVEGGKLLQGAVFEGVRPAAAGGEVGLEDRAPLTGPGPSPRPPEGTAPPTKGPTGKTAEQQEADALIAGRYVDDKRRPLAAGEKHPYAEFKMMPIRMSLVINQTKIPKLLVECANSSMPVEVRSVSLRPGQGARLDLSKLAEGPGGRTPARPHVTPTRPVEHRRKPTQPTQETHTNTLDVPIEIQGIICIYNPPDRDLLGTGAAAEKPVEAEPAPAEQPMTTPAAPAKTPAPPPAETPPGGGAMTPGGL